MEQILYNQPAFQIIRILFLGILSTGVAVALTPLLTYFLFKYRLGKQIRQDSNTPIFTALHQKKEGTPTMGGILIWGTVFILTFLFYFISQFTDGFWSAINFLSRHQTWLPIAAMMGAAFVGLVDDLMGVFRIGPKGGGLRMREKIIIYTLVALLGALWFTVKLEKAVLYLPFFGEAMIGYFWYALFFVFILVACTFSANETDGLDGLAGGVLLISFTSLLVVSFVLQRYDLAAFLSVLIGALIAFLWFNIYPARFFMGDTGAVSLGITLGVVAMLTNTALFLPFFAFILVIESASVIIQKISKKFFRRKVFLSTPIHHHFEAKGWPEAKITMRFWILSGVAAAFGIALYFLDIFIV